MTACEVFPKGLPRDPCSPYFTKRDISGPDMQPLYNRTFRPLIDPWNSIVEYYSCCNLTYANKDKFIAISGVVDLFKSIGGRGRYLAGLWEVDFFRHLVWEVSDNAQYPQSYRAPSWSWASIDSGVHYIKYGSCSVSHYATLIAADISNSQAGPSAATCQWYARIEAPIYRIGLMSNLGRNCTFGKDSAFDNQDCLKFRVSLDCDTLSARQSNHVYLFPAVVVSEVPVFGGIDRVCGIVMDLTGCAQGEFRRIGFFEVFNIVKGAKLDKLLCGQSALPSCSYETMRTVRMSGKEIHVYTFTIV